MKYQGMHIWSEMSGFTYHIVIDSYTQRCTHEKLTSSTLHDICSSMIDSPSFGPGRADLQYMPRAHA